MPDELLILGLTGSFGSGCTFVSTNFLQTKGFRGLSLSDELRRVCDQRGFEYRQGDDGGRTRLQDMGNQLRRENGGDFLAQRIIANIKAQSGPARWVVDGFRNPLEVEAFRNSFPKFFLIGVYADYNKRWERKRELYNGNSTSFDQDEKRDSGEDEDPNFGQRVTDCFRGADFVLLKNNECYAGNSNWDTVEREIKRLLDLTEMPDSHSPTEQESTMAMAYVAGQRSTCLKRHVGAIIIDRTANVIASGYNEVPWSEDPCLPKYGRCFRDKERGDFFMELKRELALDGENEHKAKNLFSKKWKALDICRALHAEERAILNLIRSGSGTRDSGLTLYTTTFPCNLCANKIVQVGVAKVVYFEPYPGQVARQTLSNHGVRQVMFSGVTFTGYFRCFGRRLS